MITETQAKTIREVLGLRFNDKIAAHLARKGFIGRNRRPYSSKNISMMVLGKRENLDVENEIARFVAEERRRKQAEARAREALYQPTESTLDQ